tara:strand:- start:3575 stop:3739 length:165 start_codon:yes stop_codon:yes gene_type:complete
MGVISNILDFIIALCLVLMIYTQISYIKADWCSWEIEKVLFTLEDIKESLNGTQ